MANFDFQNLNESTREKMISEVEMDITRDKLYYSTRLNENGIDKYPTFLKESIKNGTEETLELLIQNNDCLLSTEFSNGKPKKVPRNAAQLIANSEFNRFYIRGVCLEAIEKKIDEVEVYRARQSRQARPESELMIGMKLDPTELLADLRDSIGELPKNLPDIYSGLSVKF